MSIMHLVMIVRNEAATINDTLASVPWIDGATIVDTGSTDDTVDRVRERLPQAKIHHVTWPGRFDLARNAALDLAWRDALPGSCLLLLDGEERWQGPRPAGPGHVLVTKGDGWVWPQVRVLSATAQYQGAVHEALDVPLGPCIGRVLSRSGEAPDQRDRWKRDRAALRGLDDPRSVFYAALTDQWLGDCVRARKGFLRRLALGGWEQERYESLMRLAQIAPNRLTCVAWLLEAHDHSPHRAEPLYELARRYVQAAQWSLCYDFVRQAVKCTTPRDYLFLYEPAYGAASLELLMRAARHVGEDAVSRLAAGAILELWPNDPLALAYVA